MMCIFWDQEGPIYYELLKPGETVNTDRYKRQLLNLNDAILEKREQCKKRQHKVIFLDDNAPSYHTKPTKDIVKDLLSYMISELRVGNINTGLIIWQRHKDELLMSINVEILKEIISAIQDSVSSKYLIPFLCDDFLPSIFSRNPHSVDMVAEWLIHRVYLIELSEKDCWPENGLALVTGFFKVIEDLHEKKKKGLMSFSASLSLSKINKKMASTEFHVGCLAEFSKDLTWLMTLKSNFSCKISLSDFKESKMDVIFAVLDRVNLLDVPKVIEEFARPYAMENDVELDLCLEHYIKVLGYQSRAVARHPVLSPRNDYSFLQCPELKWGKRAWQSFGER
ncbi:mariner Mos1 transposase [Trichonephila clavipes]|nr:mariner Mos1 transposase [Trichonephila clavipes]